MIHDRIISLLKQLGALLLRFKVLDFLSVTQRNYTLSTLLRNTKKKITKQLNGNL
jgi:hypothetical protein